MLFKEFKEFKEFRSSGEKPEARSQKPGGEG
jgi:hypothetical protein